MIESFIKAGRQDVTHSLDMGGLSITDPCLSWDATEQLLQSIAAEYP